MNHFGNEILEILVNQSWQILAVFVVIAFGSLALRKASSHWRYLLWLVVLVKCVTPPVFSVPLAVLPEAQSSTDTPVSVVAEEPTEMAIQPRLNGSAESSNWNTSPGSDTYVVGENAGFIDAAAGESFALTQQERAKMVEFEQEVESGNLEPLALASETPVETEAVNKPRGFAENFLAGLVYCLPLCWLVGAGLFAALAVMRALLLHRRLCRSRKCVCSALQLEISALSAVLGMKSPPKAWLVEGYSQPFVWGLFRGAVYLPTDFSKQAMRDRDTILAHELAHVRRLDAAVNVLQLIAQGLFFFHPLVWWANRKIRQEREKCCDEIAIAALAIQPRVYSTTIVDVLVAEAREKTTQPLSTLAVAGPVKNIEERIKTIMTPNRKFYKRPTWIAILTVLLLAGLLVPTTVTLTAKAAQKTEESKEAEEDFSVADFPTSVVCFQNNDDRFGKELSVKLTKTGKVKFGQPGTVSEVSWKFLEDKPVGAKYEFTRIFPVGSPNAKTQTMVVEYNGDFTNLWNDNFQKISICQGKTTFSGTIRTTDNKPLPKSMEFLFSSRRGNSSSNVAVTHSSSDFKYEMPSGKNLLLVETKEYAPTLVGPFDAIAKEEIKGIEVLLQPGYKGKIRFVNEAGNPVPSVEVSGGMELMSCHSMHRYGKSEKNGILLIKHTLGNPYKLTAIASGYEPEEREIIFKRDKTVAWKLRQAIPTTGTLLGPDGEPVANATIRLYREADSDGNKTHLHGETGRILAKTDGKGKITIDTLDRTRIYYLLVETPKLGRHLLRDIRSGESNLKLKIGPEVIIRGTITGNLDSLKKSNGKPIISYFATLKAGNSSYCDCTKNSPVTIVNGVGHFELRNLLADSVTITAGKEKVSHTLNELNNNIEIKLTGKAAQKTEESSKAATTQPDKLAITASPKGKPESEAVGEKVKTGVSDNIVKKEKPGSGEVSIPEKWNNTIALLYREDLGLAGWIELKIDGDGNAELSRPSNPDPDQVVPCGEYKFKLGEYELGRILSCLRQQKVWELSGLHSGVVLSDEGGISFQLSASGSQLDVSYPRKLIGENARMSAIQEFMRDLMREKSRRFGCDWPVPNKGVQVRIRSVRRVWQSGQKPKFMVDVRNNGASPLDLVSALGEYCQIQVDGHWYGWAKTLIIDSPVWRIESGKTRQAAFMIELTNDWARSKEGNNPEFKPGVKEYWGEKLNILSGRHVVRIRFFTDQTKPPIESNCVTIYVQPPLTPEIKLRRDKLLAEADSKISKGIMKLSRKFPTLRKGKYGDSLREAPEPGRTNVFFRRLDIGKAQTEQHAIPEKEKFGVTVLIEEPREEPMQLATWPLYPNLGLVGQIGVGAGNPELDAALKKLVAESLAPLKELNDQLYSADRTQKGQRKFTPSPPTLQPEEAEVFIGVPLKPGPTTTKVRLSVPTGEKVENVELELVGVVDLKSSDKHCWQPGGDVLAGLPAAAAELKDEDYQYGFLFNFQAPAGSSLLPGPGCGRFLTPMKHLKGDWYGMASSYKLENGKRPGFTNMQIGIATGPWRDDNKCSLKPEKEAFAKFDAGKILCINLHEKDGRTFVYIKYNSNSTPFDQELRMVAVTKSGRVIEPKVENWRYARQLLAGAGACPPLHKGKLVFPLRIDVQYETTFSSSFENYSFPVPLKDIKSFKLQTRPIEYVGFKNISLQPDSETGVKAMPEKLQPKANHSGKSQSSKLDFRIATRAFELRMAGEAAEARKLLEKAVKENPENARAQFELARDCFYMMMGPRVAGPGQRKAISKSLNANLKQARTAIMQAIKAEPDNPRYRYWAGKIYSYTAINQSHSLLGNLFLPRNCKIAIQNYAKAVELKPDFHQARLELMGCYDRLPKNCGGDKGKAKKQAEILENSDPVYGALARCEIQPRKTRKEKIEIWEKVLAKEPDNPNACLGLARELMGSEKMSKVDMKKCLHCIDKALKLDPSKGDILLDLAQHYRLSQPEKARQTIERYLHLSPRPPVAMQALAMRELASIYKSQNKIDQAEAAQKKADGLDPTNWPSLRWLPPADIFLAP